MIENYFISDIHLKSINERNGQILLDFLRSLLKKDPKNLRLFFVGDIFDLWVSDGKVFQNKYRAVTDLVGTLTAQGVPVYFFEGNHDLHIHPFWNKVLGVEVEVNPRYFDLDGLKVRVEHGDLINLEDKDYLKLRAFLRKPIVEKVGHFMPGYLWEGIGKLWSPLSRKKSSQYRIRNVDGLRQMIRNHAIRSYTENKFDLIITGHMHVHDDWTTELNGISIRSINLGSWFEEPRALKITQGNCEWVTLD